MSELKPCPVCGRSESITYRATSGLGENVEMKMCAFSGCDFECRTGYWNQFPRTSWVSVEERLPTVNEVYLVRFGGDTYGASIFIFKSGEFFDSEVTHWLDNVPDLPD